MHGIVKIADVMSSENCLQELCAEASGLCETDADEIARFASNISTEVYPAATALLARHGKLVILKYIMDMFGGDSTADIQLTMCIRCGTEGLESRKFCTGKSCKFSGCNRITLAHAAALGGHIHVLEWLKTCGARFDAKDEEHRTPLAYAILSKSLPTVRWLVEVAQSSLAPYGERKLTHLMIAAMKGYDDIVDYLLSQGMDVNAETKRKTTALFEACLAGHFALAKRLVEVYGADPGHHSEDRFHILYYAVKSRNFEMVKWASGFGLNPNIQSYETAFHCACVNGDENIARWLVYELGVDPRDNTHCKYRLLENSVKHTGIVSWLVGTYNYEVLDDDDLYTHSRRDRWGVTESLFKIACRKDALETLQWLVQWHKGTLPKFPSISANNKYIVLACCCGSMRVAKWLVESGLQDPHAASDSSGELPIHSACRSGHLELVKWMMEVAGCQDIPTRYGTNVAMLACQSGNLELVRWLYSSKRADFSPTDRGLNVAWAASCSASVDVLEFVLTQFPTLDVNCRTEYSSPPIGVVLSSFKIKNEKDLYPLVRLLVRAGACINCVDRLPSYSRYNIKSVSLPAEELRWYRRMHFLRCLVAASTSSMRVIPDKADDDAEISEPESVRRLLFDYRLARAYDKRLASHVVGMIVTFLPDCCEWAQCPRADPFSEPTTA